MKIFQLNGKLTVIIIILLLLSSCKSSDGLNCENIKGLKIAYLPKDVITSLPVDAPEEIGMYEQTKYSTITDKNFICRLTECINSLEESKDTVLYDFEIVCFIYDDQSLSPQTLFLGKDFVTVYNGKLMNDNENLFNLFDEELYKDKQIKRNTRKR